MVNLTLKVAGFLLLLNFVLSGADRPQKDARVERPPASAVRVETREYRAKNGHSLTISSLGSFVMLGGPKIGAPVRDGYRLTYKHPLDGRRVTASAGAGMDVGAAPGSSDLVPVSFKAPAPGAVLSGGQTLTARVTVQTRDGQLRLTHLLTWKPDSNSLSVRTEIANAHAKQVVSAVALARAIDVTAEKTEAAIQGLLKHDTQRNTLLVIRCRPGVDCPPPPPTDPGPVPVGPIEVKVDSSPVIQLDGETRASLTWDLALSAQSPASVTIQYTPQDIPRP